MTEKLDFKKVYKELYQPKAKQPVVVEVPAIPFLMIDGYGDPNGELYQKTVSALYALNYMIKMKGKHFPNYVEYVVAPLEGLWWTSKDVFHLDVREDWLWTAMMRQPDFVTQEIVDWAINECQQKQPDTDFSGVRFELFAEGTCAQILHLGPYATEPESIALIDAFLEANGLINETSNMRKHHEIYLSNPLKTVPEKLKTILRVPIK